MTTTPKEPLPVYVKLEGGEEKQILGWACPECKLFHASTIYACRSEDAEAEAKRSAVQCCHRICPDCGVDMGNSQSWTCCNVCRAKRDEKRSAERIAKAKRIPWAEYHGNGVFCESTDEFYDDMGELQDGIVELWTQCKVDMDEPPVIWACAPNRLTMDAYHIVSSELEDHHEEAIEEVSDKALKRLQRMLDKWCSDVDITSWEVDYGTIVVMGDDFWGEIRAEMEQFKKEMSE